jgi:hypothetical protein
VHPRLGPDAAIVWVYGFNVGGNALFSPEDVIAIERNDDRWGLALIAAGLVGCVYFSWRCIGERGAA